MWTRMIGLGWYLMGAASCAFVLWALVWSGAEQARLAEDYPQSLPARQMVDREGRWLELYRVTALEVRDPAAGTVRHELGEGLDVWVPAGRLP